MFFKSKGKRQRSKVKRAARYPNFCLLLFAFCFLIYSASAQDATPTPEPTPTAKTSNWDWTLTIRNRTGFRLNAPHQWQMSRTLVDGKGVYKISDDWRMTLAARAHYDPVNRLGFPPRLWIDPREAVLSGKVKKVDLKLGLQQVVWGQADGLRVLDVINPLDYREFILEDFLDSRRPLWMARADVPVEKGSLQLLWIPYFAPGRLPVAGNEFGLGASFGLGLVETIARQSGAPPFDVRALPTIRPAYQLKASQFGARYSRSLGSWDWTANYFYGWEDVPVNQLVEVRNTSPKPVALFQPRYERRKVFGLTGANNFGPVVLRLEAGWNQNRSTATRNAGLARLGQFSSVAGLDYSPREWLWLSGQYFLSFASASQERLLFPRYSHLVSLYARTNFFRDRLRPELFVLTGLSERQSLLRPKLTQVVNDHWTVSLGADFFGGNRRNIFGAFRQNDRLLLEVKWSK